MVVTRKPLHTVVGLAVCCAMFAWMPESRAQDDDDLLGELSPSEDGLAPTEDEGAPPPVEDEPIEELDAAPAKPAPAAKPAEGGAAPGDFGNFDDDIPF